MPQLQIEIPDNAPDYLLKAIEERISKIGESYFPAKSYQHDLEISALTGVARALGYDLHLREAPTGGFALTRTPFSTSGS
jgi:hypothetical protein